MKKALICQSCVLSFKGLELTFFSGVYGTCIGAVNRFGREEKSLIGLSGIFIGVGEILGESKGNICWWEQLGSIERHMFLQSTKLGRTSSLHSVVRRKQKSWHDTLWKDEVPSSASTWEMCLQVLDTSGFCHQESWCGRAGRHFGAAFVSVSASDVKHRGFTTSIFSLFLIFITWNSILFFLPLFLM